LALVIAAVVWAIVTSNSAAHIDATTLCDAKGPSAVTVVLVDATDQIRPVQRAAIDNRLARVIGDLRTNERLAIYEIRPDADMLKPLFEKCRPASADNVSDLTGNKRFAQQRFDVEFKQVLQTTLDRLMGQASAERSPIMEAIQAAATKSLDAPDLSRDVPHFRRQIVMVSDMMQFSEAGSHYEGVPDFEKFHGSPVFPKYASDLTGVDVTILYLRQDNAANVQGRAHLDFWDRWFAAQGASVDDAVPIGG
jgi:hypothetical protein